MNSDFKSMVDNDIDEIEKLLKDETYTNEKYKEFTSKYHSYIDNFGDGLYGYNKKLSFYYDEKGEGLKHNLIVIKNKLIAFKAYGYCNRIKQPDASINVSNSNINQISITITFDEVREKIEDMSSLREEEIQEILEKVNKLESIVNSEDRKTKKWEMCKDTIKWLADKGVDVGITLLPLILKIS